MTDFDCCGRWSKCAAAGHCVAQHRGASCTYGRHLANGFNFLDARFKAGPYLVIDHRLYYMGVKSSSHPCSYAISTEIAQQLAPHGLRFSPFCLDNAWPEHPTDDNPCSYRVVVAIGGAEYVILNANVRMLQQDTAQRIRDTLRQVGHLARIERIGIPAKIHRTSSPAGPPMPVIPPLEPAPDSDPPAAPPEEAPKPATPKQGKPGKVDAAIPLPGQISIFDL